MHQYSELIPQIEWATGKAVLQCQSLELTLINVILLGVKFQRDSDPDIVEEVYTKHESMTLGRLQKLVNDTPDVPDTLKVQLEKFVSERNWLVHRSWTDLLPNNYSREFLIDCIDRMNRIAENALTLNKQFATVVEERVIKLGVSREALATESARLINKWFAG
jgi:hypothetical protein